MKTKTKGSLPTTVATRIAGEDITAGNFITVLSETIELPSFLWNCSDVSLAPDEPVRIHLLPRHPGVVLKVEAVCLPFVYARYANDYLSAFDTRQQQLVRLDPTTAQHLWKQLRKPFRKRRRKEKKK